VQGKLFNKREIGNDQYILNFFENHEIAKWDAKTNTFDRHGLVRAWMGCIEHHVPKTIDRIRKAHEKVILKFEIASNRSLTTRPQPSIRSINRFSMFLIGYEEK